jgi:hypothetical protein
VQTIRRSHRTLIAAFNKSDGRATPILSLLCGSVPLAREEDEDRGKDFSPLEQTPIRQKAWQQWFTTATDSTVTQMPLWTSASPLAERVSGPHQVTSSDYPSTIILRTDSTVRAWLTAGEIDWKSSKSTS